MFLSHSSNRKLILSIALIFCTVVIGGFQRSAIGEEKANESNKKCNIHKTSCTKTLSDYRVTLDIKPKPVKAMADLTFTVTLSGEEPTVNPYIDLSMPGMKMGPNHVRLKSEGNGMYRGEGIIVRCPSGRRTWKATVTIHDVGTAEFVFDVIY